MPAAPHMQGVKKKATGDLALVAIDGALPLQGYRPERSTDAIATPHKSQVYDLLTELPNDGASEPTNNVARLATVQAGEGASAIDLGQSFDELVVGSTAAANVAQAQLDGAGHRVVITPLPAIEESSAVGLPTPALQTVPELETSPRVAAAPPERFDSAQGVEVTVDVVRAVDESPIYEVAAVQAPSEVIPPASETPPAPPFYDEAPTELPPLTTPPPEQGLPPCVVTGEPVNGGAAPAEAPMIGEPPCPCNASHGSGDGGCAACSPLAECHEDSTESFPSTVHDDILELFAVDIARRCLLALHPYAADEPILTLEAVVRPSGHIVHTYARLQWHRRHWWNLRGPAKAYETEVSASIVYHPDRRRVFDVSYVDNAYFPFRNIDMTSQVTASYNEDFALRDGTGLPPKFLSDRVDVLEPYPEGRIFNFGPVREPDPRAKQLRVVRRDSNVTANQ